jgi:glycerol-3-phosphate acyltransferase PlsY
VINAENITLLIAAYLLGAIPFSLLAGKLLKGIDIREHGSGNAGATNTFRVLGKKAGIPVLALDVLKGYLAVSLACYSLYDPHTEMYVNLQLSFGVAAVLGHVFPVYVGFRGGKGVATLLGMMIGVFPQAALLSIAVFVVTLLLSKYVSLSSILAGIVFPIGVYYLSSFLIPTMFIFSLFVPVLLIATHQRNIERLIRGEESKAKIKIKRK